MRVVLRQYQTSASLPLSLRYLCSTQSAIQEQHSKKQDIVEQIIDQETKAKPFLKKQQINFTYKDYVKELISDKIYDARSERRRKQHMTNLEEQWELASDALMLKNYDLMTSHDKQKVSQRQLKAYEDGLKLNIDKLIPKIYDDHAYLKKMGKYHLGQVSSLTASFIRQGHNFLDGKVLKFIIYAQKIKLLKELMRAGAFENNDSVDSTVVDLVLEEYQKNPRNLFMVNLLSYERELNSGLKACRAQPEIKDQAVLEARNRLFNKMLYDMQSSKEVNKLRFLWSCQRYYLHEYDFYDLIIPELKSIQFRSTDPHVQLSQHKIQKEVRAVLSNTFTHSSMVSLFHELLQTCRTYDNFLISYSLVILLLSKLKGISGFLPQTKHDELNSLFKMIEFNLPQQVSHSIIEVSVKSLLAAQGNYWVLKANYNKCLEHWKKDYTVSIRGGFSSPFNALLEDERHDILVEYKNEDAEPWANSIVTIHKKESSKGTGVKTQTDVVNDLLKGNYESVLDDFLVRYTLTGNYDLTAKYNYALQDVDRTMQFHNKDEEALYKLKLAYSFFFTESYTQPLQHKHLLDLKENIEVASIKDRALFEDIQVESDKAVLEDRKEQQQMIDYINKKLGLSLKLSELEQPLSLLNKQKQSSNVQPYGSNAESDIVDKYLEKIEEEKWELYNDEIDQSELLLEERTPQPTQIKGEEDTAIKFFMLTFGIKSRERTNQLISRLLRHRILTYEKLVEFNRLPLAQAKKAAKAILETYQQMIIRIQERTAEKLYEQKHQEKINKLIVSSQVQKFFDNESDLNQVVDEGQSLQDILINRVRGQNQTYTSLKKKYDLLNNPDLKAHFQKKETGNEPKSIENEDTEAEYGSLNVHKPLFGNRKQKQLEKQKEAEEEPAVQEVSQDADYEFAMNKFAEEEQMDSNDTEIDAARRDRAILHVEKLQLQQNPSEVKSGRQQIQEQEEALEPEVLQSLNQFQIKELVQDRIFNKYIEQIISNASTTSLKDRQEVRQMLEESEKLYLAMKKDAKERNAPFENRKGKRVPSDRAYEHRPEKKEGKKMFTKKLKYSYSTSSGAPEDRQMQTQQITDIQTQNLFDLDKIEKYRSQPVSQDFLKLMKNQTEIPKVGQGLTIAKYLFLHGKRQGRRMALDPSRQMEIEFSSVVGTRGKNYQEYVSSTLYPYELEDSFYESMLTDQMSKFNRYEFKHILAHMIYHKKSFTNAQVTLFCDLCEKYQIGYSFVEIVQFIKANDIILSEEAIEKISNTWHRFSLINEDMLPFLREYCKKMSIPFRTRYYSTFCRSLIKKLNFQKLQALTSSVLAQIKPRPFKVTSTMKAHEVPKLEKAWKDNQNEKYISMYLQMLEVIVSNLNNRIPAFLLPLFVDYLRLRPEPNEKELGYGFVCCCTDKKKFETLLVYLEKHPELGTQFMFDCLMQSVLSNQYELEEFLERMLDSSVFLNRIVLTHERIKKALYIFKKTNSANSFSKFLEHCLRFQTDINQLEDVKKEMFHILNTKIEDVSITGVYNLLDFIFNAKRQEERVEYRKIKLQEEEKEKRLAQIQDSKAKEKGSAVAEPDPMQNNKSKEGESTATEPQELNLEAEVKAEKQKLSKKEIKQEKKAKKVTKSNVNALTSSILSEMDSPTLEKTKQISGMGDDTEMVSVFKVQTKRHESYRRKGVQSFGQLYRAALEMTVKEEEVKLENKKGSGPKVKQDKKK